MKKDKIIYWIATSLISAGMLMSAGMYLTKNPELMQSFRQTGYPEFFVTLLGTAKLLGAIILVIPVWNNLKEWAYAGFGFTFIGAIWTHLATNTPWVAPFIFLIILSISYWYRMKTRVASA